MGNDTITYRNVVNGLEGTQRAIALVWSGSTACIAPSGGGLGPDHRCPHQIAYDVAISGRTMFVSGR
jgi:hypothetical protein